MVMHISEVLAQTFRETGLAEDLTAWVDNLAARAENLSAWKDFQPMPGQMELPFCQEVNSEFTSTARPGADWGTWNMP